ncbi:MAG TPA: AIR synthase related protein, partial [Spirochaetota bacterium]|nr:AIR synthase related protein [Spirochaetota bacterium]
MIEEDIKIKIDDLIIAKAYNLFGEFSPKELIFLKDELFCDNVSQEGFTEFYLNRKLNYDFSIEVSYKNGVTDNVGRTAAKGIEYILKRKIDDRAVRSSDLYFFKGKLSEEQRTLIASKVLCNILIEDYFIITKEESLEGKTPFYGLPAEKGIEKPFCDVIDLNVPDEKLIDISNKGLLSLTLDEMKAIRDYYKNEVVVENRKKYGLPPYPTDLELEVFAQTWSEHCKHKIFSSTINYKDKNEEKQINSLFKTYIQKSAEIIKENRDDLLSLFKDNAGVVKLDDSYAYCIKVETHNSPSALDPYGGAMTGIVGVNRDIIGTGIGAYPIFNTDVFCFGDPRTPDEKIPEGLLTPRRIFRGVHRGVKDGGNESGIPTVNGAIVFDDSFLGKPLVFCGTGGLMPLEVNGKKSYEKYVKPGDLIVVSGGRTGKDGI